MYTHIYIYIYIYTYTYIYAYVMLKTGSPSWDQTIGAAPQSAA